MVNDAVVTRVEKTLAVVPEGVVVSYGQLADLSGLPGRARLMSKVLRKLGGEYNWHRVIRADGRIAFPEGSPQADEQRQRLTEEGIVIKNNRINLKKYGWTPDLHIILSSLQY